MQNVRICNGHGGVMICRKFGLKNLYFVICRIAFAVCKVLDACYSKIGFTTVTRQESF